MRLLPARCSWVAATLVAAIPCVIAFDYGGTLWWTQYIAALVICFTLLLSWVGSRGSGIHGGRIHILILTLWLVYLWAQTLPLDASLVRWFSPGTHSAYTDWISPFVGEAGESEKIPISVAPYSSQHFVALFGLGLAFTFAATAVLHDCSRIDWTLSVMVTGASLLGLTGLVEFFFAGEPLFVVADLAGRHFATFVNRNNAALFLNIGVAAAIALVVSGIRNHGHYPSSERQVRAIYELGLFADRSVLLGGTGGVVCIAALLGSWSSGGIVGAVFGLLLAFGASRGKKFNRVCLAVFGIAVCSVLGLLFMPGAVELVRDWRQASDLAVLRDARIDHWPDSIRAAIGYLPFGSGASTYEYAYLPFQQSTPEQWFRHADNLWLELLVEQGIPGCLFTLLLGGAVIFGLEKLGRSRDSMDQGLLTGAWYLVGVVSVSQVFDFGLIVPANLFGVLVILSAVFSRLQIRSASSSSQTDSLGHREKRFRVLRGLAGPCVVTVSIAFALPTLAFDARVESAVLSLNADWESIRADASELEGRSVQLKRLFERRPHPSLASRLVELEVQLARVEEFALAEPQDLEEAERVYRSTSPWFRRRAAWSEDAGGRNKEMSAEGARYSKAVDYTLRSFPTLPLGWRGRFDVIRLDFVDLDRDRTRIALLQLEQMFQSNPKQLMRLGLAASDSEDFDLAARFWRRSLEVSDKYINDVVRIAGEDPRIDLVSALAETIPSYLSAVEFVISQKQVDTALLEKALVVLECDQCSSQAELAACEEMRGDAAFALGRYDEAVEYYRSAKKLLPKALDCRIKLIASLKLNGLHGQADNEVEQAVQDFPDEKESIQSANHPSN